MTERELADELRDTVLQDLVAVEMMLETARRGCGDHAEVEAVLDRARATLAEDTRQLRTVISSLRHSDEAADGRHAHRTAATRRVA